MKSHHAACLGRAMLSTALVLLAVGTARSDPVVYKRALRSTGWVVVPRVGGMAFGTCWVADSDRRLVVTCHHVAGDAREILVYFPQYKEERPVVEASHYLHNCEAVAGRVIASDPARDLAVVRLASLPDGVRALPLSERGAGPGDDVHSIGNCGIRTGLSEGTLWWYTRGSVRQVHPRTVRVGKISRRVWLNETQAPVNEGDSGGPVVDDRGRLVGVTDSYSSGQRLVSQNIDVREVRAFLKETAVRSGRRLVQAPRLVGEWKYRAEAEDSPGKSLAGAGAFRRNGTFMLSRTSRPLEGRFAYANGLLWLIVKEGLVAGRPAWQGKDRFCLKIGHSELTFTRNSSKRIGNGKATATTVSLRAGLGQGRPEPAKRCHSILVARRSTPLMGKR